MSPSADRERRGRGDAGVNERTPVLIVGAGPVGLALAGELGWRGVALHADREDRRRHRAAEDGPRRPRAPWNSAAAGASRTGCATRPIPRDYPQDCVYVTGLERLRARARAVSRARAWSHARRESPQKRERVPQDMFDPILRRFAETFPHVRLRYNAELTSFAETASGVVAQVRDVATGETRDHRRRLSGRHRRRRQHWCASGSASP